ncbi:MAG: glycogen synthase [Acidobacteriota bacterium]|jgi:glycosyltransferase involved in cell wall biosynthesis|nr:glycogen synthase [Acidobacteriota bacterium]
MSEQGPLPQKVLMTADTVGGVWTYALDLSRALSERGIEVALATMGDPLSEAQRETVERIPRLRLFESTFRLEWMEEPWRDVQKASEWLLRLESRICPDVVHLNGYAHAALPWSAPKLVVAHSCVLSWWAAVKGEPAPASWDRYKTEVQAGLAAADLVVAPSAAMLASLDEHYGPLPSSRVIPNGRDPRLFRPAGPSAKEEIVFAAGRLWDEAKNLAALERVAPELPWPIYVAGQSQHPDGGEIRPHSTRLLGRLTPRAMAAWLGRAAIYALPARYEPFGLSALEAALAGCVLVLGDIPSLREVWRNRAVFVAPDDPAALRTALLSLIENPDRRNALAAGARARALELSPERMLEGYLAAYGELLASRQEVEVEGFSGRLEPAEQVAV